MKVIITGGSGLIGTALSHRLISEQHQVTILSRNPAIQPMTPGIEVVQWDGSTPNGWGRLVDGTDAIVNLAGANLGGGLWTTRRKQVLTESRLRAGTAVVEAVRQADHKPAVVIQASAIGYYRPAGDVVLDESCPAGEDFQGNLCQRWEDSTRAVEALGVRRVISRTGVVFGRGALIYNLFVLPFRIFFGGPLGSGRQFLSWIHIQDEVNGLMHFLQDETTSGAYNLMAPEPIRNADLGRIISRVYHRPYWFPIPAFAMRLALGELSTVVLDSWRGVPGRLTESGFQFAFPDAESALMNLAGSR